MISNFKFMIYDLGAVTGYGLRVTGKKVLRTLNC